MTDCMRDTAASIWPSIRSSLRGGGGRVRCTGKDKEETNWRVDYEDKERLTGKNNKKKNNKI